MVKIKIKAIIEIAGFPKEHIEGAMDKVINKLKQDFEVVDNKIYEAVELKDKMDGFWSTFCEVDVNFDKIEGLIGFCFEFMPSSLEVLSPEEMMFTNINLANILNDLLGRLHHYDMLVKNLNASNVLLKKKLGETT